MRIDGASWFAVATPVESSRKQGRSVEAWRTFIYLRLHLILLLPDPVLNTSKTPDSFDRILSTDNTEQSISLQRGESFLSESVTHKVSISRSINVTLWFARQKAVIAVLWVKLPFCYWFYLFLPFLYWLQLQSVYCLVDIRSKVHLRFPFCAHF